MRPKNFGCVRPPAPTDSRGGEGESQGNPTGGRRTSVQTEGDGMGRGDPRQMNASSSYPYVDSCQNKVSADQYHMTISWAQV